MTDSTPKRGRGRPKLDIVRTEKLCSHCNIVKPVEQFYRNKKTADGYSGWCGDCNRKYKSLSPEQKAANLAERRTKPPAVRAPKIHVPRTLQGTIPSG